MTRDPFLALLLHVDRSMAKFRQTRRVPARPITVGVYSFSDPRGWMSFHAFHERFRHETGGQAVLVHATIQPACCGLVKYLGVTYRIQPVPETGSAPHGEAVGSRTSPNRHRPRYGV